eukprot:5436315-Amphidinium_carterae.1
MRRNRVARGSPGTRVMYSGAAMDPDWYDIMPSVTNVNGFNSVVKRRGTRNLSRPAHLTMAACQSGRTFLPLRTVVLPSQEMSGIIALSTMMSSNPSPSDTRENA